MSTDPDPILSDIDALPTTSPTSTQLEHILTHLQSHFSSPSPISSTALEKLGTLARDPSYRAPLANAGALDYALTVLNNISPHINHVIRKNCYRLIANTCADEEESREVLSRQWRLFLQCFETDLLGSVGSDEAREVAGAASAAMLNFLTDNEGAGEDMVESSLTETLVRVMRLVHGRDDGHSELFPANFWGVVLDVLERFDARQTEVDVVQLTTSLLDGFDDNGGFPDEEPEDWVMVLYKLFGEESVRQEFATNQDKFRQLLRVHYSVQEQWVDVGQEISEAKYIGPNDPGVQSLAHMAKLNGPHQRNRTTQFIWLIVSMVIGQEDFPRTYSSLQGPIPRELVKWIRWPESGNGGNEYQMQLAMLIIGNLSKSANYPQFLEESQLAERLYDTVNKTAEDQTRLLGLDLLKHCFLNRLVSTRGPAFLKARPGLTLGLNSVMGLNWMTAHASLSAARIMGTPSNIQHILEPVDLKNALVENDEPASYLTRAIQVFRNKSDVPDLRLDVGRLIAAILRNMYSNDGSDSDTDTSIESRLDIFSSDLDLSEPLAFMVTAGTEDNTKRMAHAEGWFGLALLAKSKKGAEMVVATLGQPQVNQVLLQALETEQNGGASSLKIHQRQNVLVMLKNIQRHELDTETAGLSQSIEKLMASLTTNDVVPEESGR